MPDTSTSPFLLRGAGGLLDRLSFPSARRPQVSLTGHCASTQELSNYRFCPHRPLGKPWPKPSRPKASQCSPILRKQRSLPFRAQSDEPTSAHIFGRSTPPSSDAGRIRPKLAGTMSPPTAAGAPVLEASEARQGRWAEEGDRQDAACRRRSVAGGGRQRHNGRLSAGDSGRARV